MYPLRSLLAGLMLAVVACGGVGAPLVHEATHAAEREAVRVRHAADGHHTAAADGRAQVSTGCPTGTPPLDLVCTLCSGLTAALLAEADTVPDLGTASEPWTARPPPRTASHVSTPTGRGPPAA